MLRAKEAVERAVTLVDVPMKVQRTTILPLITMMAAVNSQFQVVQMKRLVTTMQMQQKTTALACNSTSVEFAEAMASLTALATATATYWMSAACVAVKASLTALVIVKETCWMNAACAEVTASLKAHATATATAQKLVTTATATA